MGDEAAAFLSVGAGHGLPLSPLWPFGQALCFSGRGSPGGWGDRLRSYSDPAPWGKGYGLQDLSLPKTLPRAVGCDMLTSFQWAGVAGVQSRQEPPLPSPCRPVLSGVGVVLELPPTLHPTFPSSNPACRPNGTSLQ